MGKRQSERVKGNAQASSSGRAAELQAAAGFKTFAALAGEGPAVAGFVADEEALDSHVRMLLQRLKKRDATTRHRVRDPTPPCLPRQSAVVLRDAPSPYLSLSLSRISLDAAGCRRWRSWRPGLRRPSRSRRPWSCPIGHGSTPGSSRSVDPSLSAAVWLPSAWPRLDSPGGWQDTDRRVREATQRVWARLVQLSGKQLATVLKAVAG